MERPFIIPENQMIISIEELRQMNLSYFYISKMVEQGDLKKLNRKYYENRNYEGMESDLYYAYAYVPSGTVCLMSAAVYYNLSTYRPETVEVAVSRKKRVTTLPDWPEIKLHYFDKERCEIGKTTVWEGANQFQIFDVEKTVVDIVCFRNQIGIQETKEVLVNYLKRSNRDINRLCRYAETLRCGGTMRTYLEVLL